MDLSLQEVDQEIADVSFKTQKLSLQHNTNADIKSRIDSVKEAVADIIRDLEGLMEEIRKKRDEVKSVCEELDAYKAYMESQRMPFDPAAVLAAEERIHQLNEALMALRERYKKDGTALKKFVDKMGEDLAKYQPIELT